MYQPPQSRRRIARAGDRGRGQIARDMHDGLRQHAMALGMRAQELQLGPPDPVAVAAPAGALREGIVTCW